MKHLIIYAHPNPKSFSHAILESVKKISSGKGMELRIRDLYDIGFDPVLKPSDFELLSRGQTADDIRTEQEHIKWADVITVIHPVWWTGFPAILKGYIDRVFTYGFAYDVADGSVRGLLKGKKVHIFSTTGTPDEIYSKTGMHNSIKQTTDTGIFSFSGLESGHTFFGSVPSAGDDRRKEYLAQVEATAGGYL